MIHARPKTPKRMRVDLLLAVIFLMSSWTRCQNQANNGDVQNASQGEAVDPPMYQGPQQPPSPNGNNIAPVDLTMLKSFWRGEGVAVPYPGKLLLTSDKLRNQRGRLTSYDSIPLHKDFFTIDLELNFSLTNVESNQGFGFAITEQVPWADQSFPSEFNFRPFGPNFKGLLLWIQDFQNMHSGTYESNNFNEEEILSRGKVCKLSAKAKGLINLTITFKQNTLTIYLVERKDGSMRRCAQFTDISFPNPIYFTLAGVDDLGGTQTVVGR